MEYEGTVYRPPSEAHSLLIQATIGCSWNRCTFCDMYKEKSFRIRSLAEIRADLLEGVQYRQYIRRIFLCDGDAMAIDTEMLLEILNIIGELYPGIDGVRIYASAKDILRKPLSDLRRLQQAGLEMVYIGLESGSDRVLKQVNKGITKQEMILGAQQILAAGIRQSVSIISGLGGAELMREHMLETADALNHMQPDYLGMLVLYAGNDTKLMKKIREGSFRLPSQQQVLEEMHLLLEHLRLEHCYFTSAHISNYIHVKGQLPSEREMLLKQIAGLRKEAI